MTGPELKPCPFCGELPTHSYHMGIMSIQCDRCKVAGCVSPQYDIAIAEWNRRAIPPAPDRIWLWGGKGNGLIYCSPTDRADYPDAVEYVRLDLCSLTPTAEELLLNEAFQLVYEAYSCPADRFELDSSYISFLRGKVTKAFSVLQVVRAKKTPQPAADTRVTDEADAVQKVLASYRNVINRTPALLSLLYDADLLPEQIITMRGAISMAAVVEGYNAGTVVNPAPSDKIAEAARVLLDAGEMPLNAKVAAVHEYANRDKGGCRPVALTEAWKAALRALAGQGETP